MTELELLKKMNRYSIPIVAIGLLAGCTAAPTPPLRADSPANPAAPEAMVRPFRNDLGVDGLTKQSRQILAQAARQQQQQWDQSGPDSGDQQGQQIQGSREQSQPSPTPNH